MEKHRAKNSNAPPDRKCPDFKRFQRVLSYTSYEIRCSKFHQNVPDGSAAPHVFPARRFDSFRSEGLGDAVRRHALEKHAVNAADDHGLLLVHFQRSGLAFVVSKEAAIRHSDLSIRHPLPVSPRHVQGNGSAFFLAEAGHDTDQQFSLAVKGPDILLLEIALATMLFQIPDGYQAVHGISRKAADRLCDDQVILPEIMEDDDEDDEEAEDSD